MIMYNICCDTVERSHIDIGIHNREKPYICIYCDQAFSTNFGLPRYLITHTGENPYKHNMFLVMSRYIIGRSLINVFVVIRCYLKLWSSKTFKEHTGENPYRYRDKTVFACSVAHKRHLSH